MNPYVEKRELLPKAYCVRIFVLKTELPFYIKFKLTLTVREVVFTIPFRIKTVDTYGKIDIGRFCDS